MFLYLDKTLHALNQCGVSVFSEFCRKDRDNVATFSYLRYKKSYVVINGLTGTQSTVNASCLFFLIEGSHFCNTLKVSEDVEQIEVNLRRIEEFNLGESQSFF